MSSQTSTFPFQADVDVLMRPPSVAVSIEWTPHVAIRRRVVCWPLPHVDVSPHVDVPCAGRSHTSTCRVLTSPCKWSAFCYKRLAIRPMHLELGPISASDYHKVFCCGAHWECIPYAGPSSYSIVRRRKRQGRPSTCYGVGTSFINTICLPHRYNTLRIVK